LRPETGRTSSVEFHRANNQLLHPLSICQIANAGILVWILINSRASVDQKEIGHATAHYAWKRDNSPTEINTISVR
jgi:hypothetical protein